MDKSEPENKSNNMSSGESDPSLDLSKGSVSTDDRAFGKLAIKKEEERNSWLSRLTWTAYLMVLIFYMLLIFFLFSKTFDVGIFSGGLYVRVNGLSALDAVTIVSLGGIPTFLLVVLIKFYQKQSSLEKSKHTDDDGVSSLENIVALGLLKQIKDGLNEKS